MIQQNKVAGALAKVREEGMEGRGKRKGRRRRNSTLKRERSIRQFARCQRHKHVLSTLEFSVR